MPNIELTDEESLALFEFLVDSLPFSKDQENWTEEELAMKAVCDKLRAVDGEDPLSFDQE